MNSFPKALESILLKILKQTYGKGTKKTGAFGHSDFKHFSSGVKKLNLHFTRQSATLPQNYLNDPVLRSGYLLYYLPVNYLKTVRVLSEFRSEELVSGRVRILDLGAGPGTSMLSVMSFYADLVQKKQMKEVWLDFTLIDQNFNSLKDAKNLHDEYRAHLEKQVPGFKSSCCVKSFDLKRGGLKRFLRGFRFHLITVGNLLNEFSNDEERFGFVSQVLQDQLQSKQGKLILIEPASLSCSRGLQVLRDKILARQLGFVHAPCLHQEACPLLKASDRDWCHFYFDWKRPDFIAHLDKLVGIKKDFLQCSYMVFADHARASPVDTWRVISNPLISKGKKELVLCGPKGRYHLKRLDRNKTRKTNDFDSVNRGDLVLWAGATSTDFSIDGQGELDRRSSLQRIIL